MCGLSPNRGKEEHIELLVFFIRFVIFSLFICTLNDFGGFSSFCEISVTINYFTFFLHMYIVNFFYDMNIPRYKSTGRMLVSEHHNEQER